ncbi:MAG: hypothetical protein QOC81_2936 [Thermoanaerobaculia bacterium]|jgi:hypothetical protein|nr:hypothetical protein [Thermoanaerobaculia bacterium]
MTEPPFTLAAIEAMSIAEMDALDAGTINAAAAAVPSLDAEALEELIAALDLLKSHKEYAAADAYHEGDVELSDQLTAAAKAAIAALAAARAQLQER